MFVLALVEYYMNLIYSLHLIYLTEKWNFVHLHFFSLCQKIRIEETQIILQIE